MKRSFYFAALAALFLMATTVANAKIRRVGYFGTPIGKTDYTDLQTAHDSASAGDTLLIFPGSYNATFSKKLIVLGYGYFVDTSSLGTAANPALQNITGSLSISVTLAAGSSNSVFDGLDGFNISGDNSGATLSGIVVQRCKGIVDMSYNNVHSGWQILQCYLNILYLYNNTISNLTVNNCYVPSIGTSGGTASTNGGQFNNCVFNSFNTFFNGGSYLVKNSIFLYSVSQATNCVFQNNLYNSDYGTLPGTANTAVTGSNMQSTVFVGYGTQGTYSNDGMWVLKAGSPAIGAGAGGANCGIYGGTNPYKLSGIPPIPSFYKVTASSTITSTNPYTITFSVRSNN